MKRAASWHQLLFAILTCLIFGASPARAQVCTPLPPDVVSWWPGDGDASDVVDGNPGTLMGAATTAPSFVRQGFKFGGVPSDVVLVGNPSNLQLQSFTIEAWISRSATTVSSFTAGGGVVFGYGLGGYALGVLDAGNLILTQVGVSLVISDTLTVTDLNFHHVAVTKSGSTVIFYLDGVGETAQSYDPGFTFTTNAGIGARGDQALSGFLGMVDELAVYSRDLTADEIQAIFNAGPAGKCPRAPVCAPLPADIVSWWPGEGDASDVVDDNTGTLAGGVTFADGMVGEAFLFDGVDGRVEVPHNPNQNPGSQLTIEAWVNPSSYAHGRTIFQKRSPSNVGGYVFESVHAPFGPENSLQFVIMIGGTYTTVQAPANVVSIGTWQHVAATYDGTAMRIYVNGAEVAEMAVSGDIDAVSDPVVMGRNVVSPEIAWDGLIDEISLYARALDPVEIQAIFDAGSAGKCRPGESRSGIR